MNIDMASIQPEGIDYYSILQLERIASEEQIRKAFRKLSLKYHPDRHLHSTASSTNEFQLLYRAYEVLSDPRKKEKYDQYGPTLRPYHRNSIKEALAKLMPMLCSTVASFWTGASYGANLLSWHNCLIAELLFTTGIAYVSTRPTVGRSMGNKKTNGRGFSDVVVIAMASLFIGNTSAWGMIQTFQVIGQVIGHDS